MGSERLEKAVIQWECQQHLNKVSNLTDQQAWEQLALCYTEEAVLASTFVDQLVMIGDNWFTSRRDGTIEMKYGKPGL